jgi:hydroxymethylbilane synthase
MQTLVIGSRGSALALRQSRWIKSRLETLYPRLTVAIETIKTTGDRIQSASLAQIGGKGVFTKELEDALLDRRIDLAVHSLKDLPTTLPEGLHLAAVTEREDVRDAMIVATQHKGDVATIAGLREGAVVGTSSLRRAAQLRHLRRDLEVEDLRGNVDTRLRKLDDGLYDAILLASAGLVRLGLSDRITARLSIDDMLPAVGQGALGIEARTDDIRVNDALAVLNDAATRAAAEAERAVLRALGGGCAVPIAAHARIADGKLMLEALVAELSGERLIRDRIEGSPSEAVALGEAMAERLIGAGADELLRGFHGTS